MHPAAVYSVILFATTQSYSYSLSGIARDWEKIEQEYELWTGQLKSHHALK